jgi:chorismate lyase
MAGGFMTKNGSMVMVHDRLAASRSPASRQAPQDWPPRRWHDITTRPHPPLPPRVRDWVGLGTSMTARIQTVANAPIDVEVLRQRIGRLHPDERHFFTDPPGLHGTVREVCLSARGVPLLVARTTLTSRRLQTHPTIRELGNHALGSLLFAGGKASPWTAREVIRLGADSPLFALVRRRHRGVQAHYWARRTLFWLFDEPLLVTEIFMPELIHHPRADKA